MSLVTVDHEPGAWPGPDQRVFGGAYVGRFGAEGVEQHKEDKVNISLAARCVCVSPTPLHREWYHSTSVLLSPAHSQRLISALYDLSAVDFDLPAEGVDLDETWPSFVL